MSAPQGQGQARHFPLGEPTNRAPPPAAQAIKGRPGWFRLADGQDVYREPTLPRRAGP